MNKSNTTVTIFKDCSPSVTVILAIVAWTVFVIGLFANSTLLYLVLKKLASGKRNDKLFLLNIIVANLISLLGSLLGETLARGNFVTLAQKHCIYYHQFSFISLFNNLTSMAALCYILYENITKFPANRLLNFSLSLKIVAASWILSLVLVPAAQSGFIIVDVQGVGICTKSDQTPSSEEVSSFFSVIGLVTIWITVNAAVIRLSLTKVHQKLKQHRKQTEQVLHNITTAKVISFNKQAYAMVFCYSICWTPFGISAALTAANVISFHSCAYFACLIGAHASAASTPLIYLTIDKRFRIKCGTGIREAVRSSQIHTTN